MLEAKPLIKCLGICVVFADCKLDPLQAARPSGGNGGRQELHSDATMPKRRKQADTQSADVLAGVAEGRLDVAPAYDVRLLQCDMTLAVRHETTVESERLVTRWSLEQR